MKRMILAISALALMAAAGCSNENGGDGTMVNNGAADGNTVPEGSESDPNPPTTQGTAMPATEFASALAASDMFEIESSRLALQKAQSADVKKFAQQMVDGHTQSSAKLKTLAAAQTPPIVLPTALPNDKQAIVSKLRDTSANAFDAAYMAEQVTAHQNTLAMLRAFVAGGDHAALKQLADELIPIVAGHLEMARGMQTKTQASANGAR